MPNLCIIPARAIEDRSLTPMELRALMAVGLYTNSAGKGVWASQRTMAERAGMSRQHMNASLRSLEAKGYIRRRSRHHPKTGARMTSMVDIVLDDEVPTHPVPESETTPVSDSGTAPVPESGTQTTHVNDPPSTTTVVAISEEYRADLTAILARSKNPEGLAQEMLALHDGTAGEYPWSVIGRAIHDMNVVGAPPSPRALRKFCEGVDQHPATTNGHGGGGRRGRLDLDRVHRELAAREAAERGTDG